MLRGECYYRGLYFSLLPVTAVALQTSELYSHAIRIMLIKSTKSIDEEALNLGRTEATSDGSSLPVTG